MPRGPMRHEKAKDFKKAIVRLLKELRPFRILMIVGLVLAMAGSILSLMAPNRLSDMIDEISQGLVVNTENLKTITSHVQEHLTEEHIRTVLPQILNVQLDQATINQVMVSELSDEERRTFQEFMSVVATDPVNAIQLLGTLNEDVLSLILKDASYDGNLIPVADQIQLVQAISDPNASPAALLGRLPDSVKTLFLTPFEVDGKTITIEDQVQFLSTMATLDQDASSTELYQKIDTLPKTIRQVIEPVMNLERIRNITIFLIGLYLLSSVFTYIQSRSMTVVSNNFARSLRTRIAHKINRLPLKYFDHTQTGDILSRVTNDVDTIAQSMNQSFASLVSAITLLLGSVFMMFITNWIMALTAISASLIGFTFMFMILGKSQKYFIGRQKYLGDLNGHIEEIYSGLNVVKVYNGKQLAFQEFDQLNDKVYTANRKSQFLSGLMGPLMNFIGNFGYVAVCIVGALLTMNGHITFGVIVAFITYVRLFTSPLSQIGQAMTSLQTTAAASERVFEFSDEEELPIENAIEKHLTKQEVKGNIEFKNVVFTYAGNDQPTIKNFSAKAKAGQKIAIVGPTGAGKTTMVNLLMKFYDIDQGDILIDGISTKELSRSNIHELFTMVLQDTWLFDGSVRENIAFNTPDVSLDRIKEVCKVVGLDHFIRTLPHGYDSKISESDSVSSGQRQLLTIARGMIEDAPFLILDEATSNVDTRTEELVQLAMDKLSEGKTSFIIAHRLSTIKNADLILVMKDGDIVEQGTHQSLLKKKGFYATLYNSQFEQVEE